MLPPKKPELRSRRHALQVAGAAALGGLLPASRSALAQAYPSQPIRIVIPFAAGGTLDVAVRPLSIPLARQLGQSIIIDNRAGANGVIGTEYVAKAPADGHTLLAVTASFVLNPSMYKELKYDVIKDFTPITELMSGVGFVVIVHPSVQANNLQELIALDKKPGQQIAYATPGVGNTIHIATELFNQRVGTHFLHVPYKGSSTSLNAVVSGEAQMAIMPPGIVMPFIRAGKLRALAFTGTKRLPELPDVPLMAEAGVSDFVFQGTWMGLFAPGGTPKPIIDRLYTEVNKSLLLPELRKTLSTAVAGYVPNGNTPEQFTRQVRDDLQRYSDILRKLNIKAE